jgi:hypothetical protein
MNRANHGALLYDRLPITIVKRRTPKLQPGVSERVRIGPPRIPAGGGSFDPFGQPDRSSEGRLSFVSHVLWAISHAIGEGWLEGCAL